MILEALFWLTTVLIVYHHLIYPLLLKLLGTRLRRRAAHRADPAATTAYPTITVIVPAYQEQMHIRSKVANLADLDYPSDRFHCIIASDGSKDQTVPRARKALEVLDTNPPIEILEFRNNRGKVAVLNELISQATSDIVVLTDASALLEPDALRRMAGHFADPAVGAAGGRYVLTKMSGEGEEAYWTYQNQIRMNEAAFGAPMGMTGAFYGFRRRLWTPLEDDVINDDFMLPMGIVAQGARAIYDPELKASERERTRRQQEWRRRIRIAAGNVQQVCRLPALASPGRPGIAFCFLSGKALRAFMPIIMLSALLLNVTLAAADPFYALLLSTHCGLYAVAVAAICLRGERLPKIVDWLGYLVEGHLAGLLGIYRYSRGLETGQSQAAMKTLDADSDEQYLHPLVSAGKRVVDIFAGLVAFAVFAVAFIPVAIAIKASSPGPLFYRQLRVGRSWPDRTELFHLIKFRTMRTDAETASGAVWAKENDPRITTVGQFLRTSRLDELPQCINVLRGEMSIIGPRPERPQFFAMLEREIPYYIERTYGVLPGITGLAQVNQGYDTTIEDVRNKVFWDHTYALRLASPFRWLATDIGVVFKTVKVMAFRMGR
ncbi:MAG: sugar transferase [Pseudomonadota bacterium]